MIKKDIQITLEKLGLTANQTKIYLYLTEVIDASALSISKSLSIPRTTIYLELERLKEKGYVISNTINKSTRYKITHPQSLRTKLNNEFSEFTKIYSNIDELIKTIESNQKDFHEIYSINIYKRQEGIKQLLWNILSSGTKEVIGFTPGTLDDIIDRDFAEEWRLEFKRRDMFNRIILNNAVPLDWSNIPGFLEENVEARTLSKEKIFFERELLIYGDTLTIMSKKDDPDQYGVEIKDRLLVSSYKQIFEFLWENVAEKISG